MIDKLHHSDDCAGHDFLIKSFQSKIDNTTYQFCTSCYNTFTKRSDICCKAPSIQFIRYPIAGEKYQLRKQCRNCFTLFPKNHKHSEVPDITKVQLYVPVDSSRYSLLSEEQQKFTSYVNGLRKKEFFKQHDDYLKSPQWREIRQAVLKRDNYICQGCLLVKATQVHHKTYERWKNEMAFDLISLCTPCHNKLHADD